VRSRDGNADSAGCGADRDFAIVDGNDRVLGDCETAVSSRRPRPKAGRTAVVQPLGGTLGIKLRGTRRFVPLKDRLPIPLRSGIGAAAGSVRVTTAAGKRKTQSGTLQGDAGDDVLCS